MYKFLNKLFERVCSNKQIQAIFDDFSEQVSLIFADFLKSALRFCAMIVLSKLAASINTPLGVLISIILQVAVLFEVLYFLYKKWYKRL